MADRISERQDHEDDEEHDSQGDRESASLTVGGFLRASERLISSPSLLELHAPETRPPARCCGRAAQTTLPSADLECQRDARNILGSLRP